MVQSKEELLSMATQWVNHAKADIRQQLIQFMESVGTDQATLADALCLTHGEIDQILNGDGEISLSTFAKMLIASDMVLEIKPINAMNGGTRQAAPRGGMRPSPRGGMRPSPRGGMPMPPHGMRPMGGMPTPPHGMPMPPHGMRPMGGMPTPPMGGYPTPSEMGHAPMGMPQGQEVDLDELDRCELIHLINQQGFGHEINTSHATRKELIAFLEAKEQQQMTQEIPTIQPTNRGIEVEDECVEAEATHEPYGGEAVEANENGNANAIAEALAEQIRNNPQLASVLGQLING